MVIASLIIFAGLLAVFVFYLITLSNTLKAIRPANRTTEPSMVWLMFIPVFNLVWQFILYGKLKDSINNEYRSRGMTERSDSTYKIGIASAILLIIGSVFNAFESNMSQDMFSLAGFVTWIIYWVQINQHKKTLQNLPPEHFGDSEIFGHVNRI